MCNKPFAIAPALHPSVISAKESVPVSCEVPVTCSKPPTSEEWTLVTFKRHPRLAIKSNSMLHVACTIRQSCPSSGSLESQVCFSKKHAKFPSDKDLAWAWLVASQRLDFVPTRYSYFCSEHFTEEQFNLTQKGRRLRPNAVPTRFRVNHKVIQKTPTLFPSPKPSETQPKVKIEPKQHFGVKKTPKKVFPVQPRVPILPKQASDAQTPITIAPKPLVNDVPLAPNPVIDLSSIANTVVNSNLIQAAVKAYRQSTNANMSQQQQATPVSVYVVHPQPNGSNIVTIPSVQDLGSVPTQNGGSLPTSSFQPATSSKPQNVDSYGERLKNIHKIRSYENRITKYRKDIKILQLKHKIQQNKIEKLKDIIKDLRRANWVGDDESEEEDMSEDLSEDEIYSEYLKHQTAESEKEDFSIDGDSTQSA
ncbi:hypothetical protein JTE90_015146 [Oedothorax gibbosus]|uniref:THAP-type domain-containing protein n=1 Tax=Oedothorax gibbosus TaxID=931172 RepID=A0AAV6VTC8_9ARAC|nr:hypothetical protein JTE90_015146 [Oedothorax gibbosus]